MGIAGTTSTGGYVVDQFFFSSSSFSSSAEQRKKARASTRGEEILVLAEFLRDGINCFSECRSADEESLHCKGKTFRLYRSEFAFTTSERKRIFVVTEEDLTVNSLDATQERVCQRIRVLEQRSYGNPPPMDLLGQSLDRFTKLEEGGAWDSFARFFDTNDETLGLLLTQLLVVLKKALIVHEQHIAYESAELQETLWARFEEMKRKIGQFVPMVLQMDKLTLLSVRPELMRGWLIKRGDKGIVRSWKKRWFAQKGKKLFYYRDDNANRSPMGNISLDQMRAVENRSDPSLGQYVGVHVPGRIYFLAPFSKTEEEQQYWLRGLRNWKNYLKHQRYDAEEEAEAGLMVGYLWKKGDKGKVTNSWKRRWCTQIGNKLFYYVDTKTQAAGSIDLNALNWVHFPAKNPKLKIRLHTIGEIDRVWRLKCDSETEYEAWRVGLLEYCSTAPPMNSKYYKEVQDDRILNRRTIIEVSRSVRELAPSINTEPQAANEEEESSSEEEQSNDRDCSKCSKHNGLCRVFCCYCGTKLADAPKRRATVMMRDEALPPLPSNTPDESDTLAYNAYMDLKEKYRRAGINPAAQRRKRKLKVVRTKSIRVSPGDSSEEEESVVWQTTEDASSEEEEMMHSSYVSAVPNFSWATDDSYAVL